MENKHTQKPKNKAVLAVIGRIVLTVIAAVVILFAGSLVALILVSEDIHLVIAYMAGYLLPALLLPLIWLKNRKKYGKIWLMAAAMFAIITGVHFGMVKYDQSIRINTSSSEYIYEVTEEDAFVFIVHKDNPIGNLTTEQIQGIYSGAITNWKEVGGENKEIKAYQCERGSVNQTMMEHFMGETALMEAPVEMGYGYLYAWGEQVSEYRNKKDSIGFCFTSYVRGNPDVKLLSIDGVAPTQENIQNGSYPIATPGFALADEEDGD